MERQRSEHTFAKVYGEQNEKLLQYEREKESIRKRDETKAELESLLKKYITQQNSKGERIDERGRGNACAQLVGLAQDQMDKMHSKMDKTVYDINHMESKCKKLILKVYS